MSMRLSECVRECYWTMVRLETVHLRLTKVGEEAGLDSGGNTIPTRLCRVAREREVNEDSEEAGGQEAVPAGDQGHVVHTGIEELPGQSPCYVQQSEGKILIKSQWR